MFIFDMQNTDIKKIHMIGIGGVSMSGIATYLKVHGFSVSGSDRKSTQKTDRLLEQGIPVFLKQGAENIQNPDLVIFTDAMPKDHPEMVAAQESGCPVVSRGVFLGALMRNFKNSIAVSGSHGKSTTTSMLAKIMITADVDPTILLGGALDEMDGNVMVGHSDYFITEACEYKGNIRYYYPKTVIVTNIDADHLDYFKNIENIITCFSEYMSHLGQDGIAILNADDANTMKTASSVTNGRLVTFGINAKDADYLVHNILADELNRPCFDIRFPDGKVYSFKLGVVGRHNMLNAAAAIAAANENGIPIEIIQRALANFKNLHRRLEVIGKAKGAVIMTDYGHHPVEIRSTLEALGENRKFNLICVFQPHTFSRTKDLLKEFSESFYSADETIVTDIYGDREAFDPSIHSTHLTKLMEEKNINVKYIPTFDEAKDYLYQKLSEEDVVLTTGCGPAHVLAHMLVQDMPEAEIKA